MVGTYASVLAQKRIRSHADRLRADVEGDVENFDGLLKLTVIRVKYTLHVTPEQEADAQWAFEHYLQHCPVAQSVIAAITIEDQLELVVE